MSHVTLFDTSKDIIDELAKYAEQHAGKIPDHIFSQAISEYGYNDEQENDIIEKMVMHEKHQFGRTNGFFTLQLEP